MAHELGHGLLGPNAHEGYGIMQAKLPISDLSWKTLYFTAAQSKRIRTELLARNQELRSTGVAASDRLVHPKQPAGIDVTLRPAWLQKVNER